MAEDRQTPIAKRIPREMKAVNSWICWQLVCNDCDRTLGLDFVSGCPNCDEKPDKIPIDPTTGTYGKTNDPSTWDRFRTAREHYQATPESVGLGFVFSPSDPFVGVDLDHCRDPETDEIEPWAMRIIEQVASYTEVSPSGTGAHIIAVGEKPGDRYRRGDVEMYDSSRFFTITGRIIRGYDTTPQERQTALETVYDQFLASEEEPDETGETAHTKGVTSSPELPEASEAVSTFVGFPGGDSALIRKAKNAENGEKFARLFDGRTAGYPSQSEADLGLCRILAFWAGPNEKRIDRLFRQSGLMRPKWDEIHYADGTTYGEQAIRKAIDTQRREGFYRPKTDPTAEAMSDGGRPEASNPTISGVVHALWAMGAASTTEIHEHHAVDRRKRQVNEALDNLIELEIVGFRKEGRTTIHFLND